MIVPFTSDALQAACLQLNGFGASIFLLDANKKVLFLTPSKSIPRIPPTSWLTYDEKDLARKARECAFAVRMNCKKWTLDAIRQDCPLLSSQVTCTSKLSIWNQLWIFLKFLFWSSSYMRKRLPQQWSSSSRRILSSLSVSFSLEFHVLAKVPFRKLWSRKMHLGDMWTKTNWKHESTARRRLNAHLTAEWILSLIGNRRRNVTASSKKV